MVETKVRNCLACQIACPTMSSEPLQMSLLPDSAFGEVSIDFALVSGETLLPW